MKPSADPMGSAIADYFRNGKAARLRVFSPDFDEDEIPVPDLFRTFNEMPPLEQLALRQARGHVLDVGAGAGCHSLALQDMGLRTTAIDISPLSVATMRQRGVMHVVEQDFWQMTGSFDTILMLMNGIGIAGSSNRLPAFFAHLATLLAPGGQVLADSTDVRYIFDDDEGDGAFLPTDHYYGEWQYRMQYKAVKGGWFPWLYLDFATLSKAATAQGFSVEMLGEGEHYDFLVRMVRRP